MKLCSSFTQYPISSSTVQGIGLIRQFSRHDRRGILIASFSSANLCVWWGSGWRSRGIHLCGSFLPIYAGLCKHCDICISLHSLFSGGFGNSLLSNSF